MAPRIALFGITKRYGAVTACDDVSLAILPGELHGVLGENGAGKSTLMKIIYGALRPDLGSLSWNGQSVCLSSPRAARALGISMVFQHFSLFESLTVAENVLLGLPTDHKLEQVVERLGMLAAEYGLELDPRRPLHSLSVGERQRVEIARALLSEPRLLILDEPTSVLTPQAVDKLFVTLRRLSADGCSILYISHKLDEVRALCQRCTVLRAGRVTGQADPREHDSASLARLMVGSEPQKLARTPSTSKPTDKPALDVRGLCLASADPHGTSLVDITLSVRAGEIVGVAGVSGNGQRELEAALSGEDCRADGRMIFLFGRDVTGATPLARRRQGLRVVPEERLGRGAVPSLPLTKNMLLTRDEAIGRLGLLREKQLVEHTSGLIQRARVKANGPGAAARSLSGGNLQKFIVAREVEAKPLVLIAAQPTWGVDVGAAAQIRADLLALRASGCAVLVISEELEELFELCDRLFVIARGKLSPSLPIADATVQQVGVWMSGGWPGGTCVSAQQLAVDAFRLRLEPRPAPQKTLALTTPLLALAITIALGSALFMLLGVDSLGALRMFFVEPVRSAQGWSELAVRATPLILIALGLSVCYRANVWNIGAEGQYILGAVFAGGASLRADASTGGWYVIVVLLAGIVGGMLWAALVAVLRDRFHANEILVSLMLVYVAEQLLGYLVYGPWKDPQGYNFPQTISFVEAARLPRMIRGYRIHYGAPITVLAVLGTSLFVFRTFAGFRLQVVGLAPAAARYAGFFARRSLWTALLLTGGLAGLAGALEVSGPLGQLTPQLPVGYGFAAIIVAFVGRLHPLGVVLSAFLMSLFYIGGELAQSRLGLPKSLSSVFQGLLLFALLACDTLINQRIRLVRHEPPAALPNGTLAELPKSNQAAR